jgi:peptide/nickel transport system substrate-binding protein
MDYRYQKILGKITLISIVGILVLSACTAKTSLPASTEVTPEPTLEPTPTAKATTKLTVCLGEEPQTLYLYAGSSQAMWSVLEAIYDGPIDTQNNTPVPVILSDLPSLENGGVKIQSAAVSQGDKVANIQGDVVSLQKGVKVFPEGCTSESCAIEWDGSSSLILVQMTADFSLLLDLKWSDGEALTAEDSAYSFQLSADPATKVIKTNIERTAAYEAVDAQTVKWTGIPGYLTTRPATFFWLPQPKHLLSTFSASDLNTAEITNKIPKGWGAYQIAEWLPGSEIRLVKNPNYFKSSEGLPKFDELIYRFLPTVPNADISPLVNGECDILDTSTGLSDQIQSVRELELAGKLTSYFGQGPAWESINFGIKPASYDAVYNPYEDRQDFFADPRTRQAFAACINRPAIITDVLFSQSQTPPTYLPLTNPLASQGLPLIGYDTAAGIQLLDEVGWKDSDGDPNTPRIAANVPNVFNSTPFSITYSVADTEQNWQIAAIVVSSMKDCGVEVTPQFLAPSELLAAGPEGPLFGRKFDLAQLGWSSGNMPSCFLYTSSEVPSEANQWLGTQYGGVNLTGYSNADYDKACSAMLNSGLDADTFNQNNQITQQMLANDLPMLPLFYQIKAMASRVDLCGLTLDTSARSALGNIEALEILKTCAPK